ncbi:MAG: hypothetical protein WBB28_01905 [Crinalium sp.]
MANTGELNVPMIQEIQKAIASDYASFDMTSWHTRKSQDELYRECGTCFCIGGYAILLSATKPELIAGKPLDSEIQEYINAIQTVKTNYSILNSDVALTARTAAHILGIQDSKESYSALFSVNHWPGPFKTQYEQATQDIERWQRDRAFDPDLTTIEQGRKFLETRARVAIARLQYLIDNNK